MTVAPGTPAGPGTPATNDPAKVPAFPAPRARSRPSREEPPDLSGLHPLLGRQLSRLRLSPGRGPDSPADGSASSGQAQVWQQLLERVSSTYTDADSDRTALERSIEIYSREMSDLYEELRGRSEFTWAIVQNAAEAILTIDAEDRISSFNPAAERMFGWPAEEVLGGNIAELLQQGGEMPRLTAILAERLGENRHADITTEARGRRRDGKVFPMMTSISVDVVAGHRVTTAVIRDISDQKSFEAQLRYQAGHDALTGMPNRARFNELLDHQLQEAAGEGSDMALLFCDLDRFKMINDTLGHQVGDGVLIRAAQRFRIAVRSGDLVARLAGDEFVVLCPRITGMTEARMVAESIVSAFSEPFTVDGHEVVVSVSVGVVNADLTISGEELLRKADLAMYAAKRAGRSRVQVYETGMVSVVTERMDVENGLRSALRENELVLHYQPIVRLGDRRVQEVEALVRWERPGHGLMAPGTFLSVAEEAGLAPALDRWVLETACRDAASWPSPVAVSVNLSERLLSQTGVVELVMDVLERTGLSPYRLGIEVTEHLLGRNVPEAVRALGRLRELGIEVYLDDFGTEYSSLSRLRQLSLDVLKIDQSFVADLGEPSGQVIVSAIIGMAHGLGLVVVAEGVEETAQLDILVGLGCDAVQGFLLARPLPVDQLQEFLREHAIEERAGELGRVLLPPYT